MSDEIRASDVRCGHCGLHPDQAGRLNVHVPIAGRDPDSPRRRCLGAFVAVELLRAQVAAVEALCESPVNPEYASVSKANVLRALRGTVSSSSTREANNHEQ